MTIDSVRIEAATSDSKSTFCTAFEGVKRIATGPIAEVAAAVKPVVDANRLSPILIFDDTTSQLVEIDFRGSVQDVIDRIQAKGAPATAVVDSTDKRGPGRPKLGVTAREVTLLPRHWEWLGRQPGGASVALRRLVETARRSDDGDSNRRLAAEALHRFLSAMAGDLPGFEEALRAFYQSDDAQFEKCTAAWPPDIRAHAQKLLKQVRSAS